MPEQLPTLRDMIQNVLDSGVTYRELEARAIDEATGKRASRSIFFDIATGKLDRIPYDYHLRAIAAGLRAPYESVRQAAISQWLPAGSEETPEEAEAERQKMIQDLLALRAQTEEALRKLDEMDGRGDEAKSA